MGDLREPDSGAAAGNDTVSTTPWTSLSSNSSSSSIRPESFKKAEKSVQLIISKVLPTVVSEERRNKVIDYLQRLLRTSIGCEVIPYGSVPLKTYLPDGDIDLTVFGGIFSDGLVKDVISVLEAENQNNAAEFVVKDVQHIGAEVKIVKCIVENIVVDITFNQIGGLSTLCFFEQVDRLIGKENLFKRSIILIKAWCYYESRILGGHHGLISTYALETLVLYIFHLFHSLLNDPLAVLYKFLDYYSKFEWENYCISIFGPIRLSSLQDFVVERPDSCGDNLLLTSEFVGHFVDLFSAPSKGVEMKPQFFRMKHLNIMDPLKKTNNLGRCVNQASFFRIRSAFTFGAKQLSLILMDPEKDIEDGLSKFFFNTLNRPGSGQRPDVHGFGPIWEDSEIDSGLKERVVFPTESTNSFGTVEDCGSAPDGSFHNAVSDMKALGGYTTYKCTGKVQEDTVKVLPSKILAEEDQNIMGKALDERSFGDATDLATLRFEVSNNLPKYQGLTLESPSPHFMPHLYFSNSRLSNGDKRSPSSHKIHTNNCKKGVSCESGDGDDGFSTGINSIGENDVQISAGLENVDSANIKVSQPENSHSVALQSAAVSINVPESLNPIQDLSGDYDNHFNYLLYGWSCYQYSLGMPPFPVNAMPPHLFPLKNLWDAAAQQSSQFNQNGFSHVRVNGGIPAPPLYAGNPVVIPGVFFGYEEVPKPRGTGTFLPSMNRPVQQTFRHSPTRGRSQASSRSPRYNNRNTVFVENGVLDHSNHELPQSPVSVDQSAPKLGHLDAANPSFSSSPRGKVQANGSALVLQDHGGFELLPSVSNVAPPPLLERGKQRHQNSPTSSPRNSAPVSPSNGIQKFKPVRDYERLSMKSSSYHLKDNEDFPPLSL